MGRAFYCKQIDIIHFLWGGFQPDNIGACEAFDFYGNIFHIWTSLPFSFLMPGRRGGALRALPEIYQVKARMIEALHKCNQRLISLQLDKLH